MSLLFAPYLRAADQSNVPISGAFLSFYATQTSTPQPIFADVNLTIPLQNPLPSDSNGIWPAIWLDDSLPAYKAVMQVPDVTNPAIPGAIVSGPNGTIDPYNTIVGRIPQTAAELSANITPTTFTFAESDARRYGASQANPDNSLAINTALLVSAAGGPAAYLPAGTWTHTSALNITANASMRGEGAYTILRPVGCNGINFQTQTTQGARFLRDFVIDGTSATGNIGINCNLDSIAGPRISGVRFSNLYILNFSSGTGVFCRGMWDCNFQSCFLWNNKQGIDINDTSVMIRIIDCETQLGVGSVGIAGSAGVIVRFGIGGQQPEDISIVRLHTFLYDKGIDLQTGLTININHCDLDFCQVGGIHVTEPNGGVSIRDCWIATNNAAVATYGISMDNVAIPPGANFTIDNNYIVCNNANVGSQGIVAGNLQNDVTITNNSFIGWAAGVTIGANVANRVQKNYFQVTNNCVIVNSLATDPEVGPNHISTGNPILFTGAAPPTGWTYYGRGSFAGGFQGYTVAPANVTINWEACGRFVILSWADILGTSTSAVLSFNGMPPAIQPLTAHNKEVNVRDNGTSAMGVAVVAAAGTGIVSFTKDLNGGAVTGTGNKGLPNGDLVYPLS